MMSTAKVLVLMAWLTLMAQANEVYLRCGQLFDPVTGTTFTNKIVSVIDGKIYNISNYGEINPPNDLVIDLSGSFVMPGLIDTHVHLFLRTYQYYDWDDQVVKENPYERTLRAAKFAERTLQIGFTSVRDLGTEGAEDADLALKNSIIEGTVAGPRLYISSRAIVSTGGYPPKWYNAEFFGGEVADGVEEMRKVVRRQLNIGGADWIKLYGDYSRYQGKYYPLFTPEEMEMAVSEAKEVNSQVAVHAKEPITIIRAVRAGAKSIEHGTSANDEALLEMKNYNVPLVPTLTITESMARYNPDDPARLEAWEKSQAIFKRALALGVPIVCGSDAGGFPNGENVRELELMVQLGMSNLAALKSATHLAGEMTQGTSIPTIGVLTLGAFADLIAIQGNPLSNISNLHNVHFVMRDGIVFRHD